MSQKIVIALGGNALGNTVAEQKEAVLITAKSIVDLAELGHKVMICHGNGPQVGMINNTFSEAYTGKKLSFAMPFPECGAMSQGYIGYHIQNAIKNELLARGLKKNVATIVTQVMVDKADPAFSNPTKPIGVFMTQEQANEFAKEKNCVVKEDSGRGYRQVIASPEPKDIVEKELISQLLQGENILVVGGGGGIPVIEEKGKFIGVDAVIDKDKTSAKLAELVDADGLIILTAVNQVKINYKRPDEKSLSEVSLKELDQLIAEEQFAPGSMLPKIQACYSFVERTGKHAYIGDLVDVKEIIGKTAGTKIYR